MTPLPRARTTPMHRPMGLAVARESFLTAGPVDEFAVRAPILTSWQRSRAFRVLADRPDLHFVKEPNPHSPLMLCSEPILRQLHDELTDQPISIVLTDANGLVLDRRTPRGQLTRKLDQVNLAPGFSYAESLVGTNGVGTTLESGTPTLVSGHEHYAENLERLTCAGAPIHHPISGALLGALDLTTWAKEPGSLLLTLAVTTARSIERNMLTEASQDELALFREDGGSTVPKDEKDLPSTIERSDEHAQDIYTETLESAEETYGDGERAHRTAYASLKHSYEKVGDHWEPKDHKGPSDEGAKQGGPGRHETKGGVDANASKAHLEDVAKQLDVPGRSTMNKDELVDAIQKANAKETRKAREKRPPAILDPMPSALVTGVSRRAGIA